MKISVVIPVFNTERYLRECLDSLTGQTIFADMELIIVDDGSTDGSPAICDDYAERYKNIKVIHKANSGVSSARNTGIDAAVGEYIGFVDSDDNARPDMYRFLMEAAEKTGADMSFCGIEHPYPDRDVVIKYPFENNVPLGRDYIQNTVAAFMLADASFNSLCNKLFKRSVVEKNGLRLSDGKKQGEDREFVLRFLAVCGSVCGTPYTGYYYRYVRTGAVQKPRQDYVDTIFEQLELDRGLFEKLGIVGGRFEEPAALTAASQLVCALTFAENKLRGRERTKLMRAVVGDGRAQKLITDNFKLLTEQNTRFNAILIRLAKGKNVVGIRVVIFLMKIKVKAYNFRTGEAR
ncbi:MAG: glycosyltransferase [Clostridiales bacterium]|nr:glycosyltransferase [Clostridiales bacterium]